MRHIRWLLIALLLCTLAALFLTSQWVVSPAGSSEPDNRWSMILTHYLVICYTWGLLSLILLRVIERLEFSPGHWLSNGSILLGLGVGLSLLHVLITLVGLEAYHRATSAIVMHREFDLPARLIRSLPSNMAIYLVIVSVAVAVKANRRSHERAVHAAELEAQLKSAQLAVLSNQLQPHFLFNTLNAIASLTRESPAAAEEMIVRLCVLLRASLETKNHQEVALQTEMEILDKYVSIQRVRFGDRVNIDVDIPEDCLAAAVPAFALQPLVENAIEHGFREPRSVAKIVIVARRVSDELRISVIDNGVGSKASHSDGCGTGMANTAARLERLYGPRQQFTYGDLPEGGFQVELKIPYRAIAGVRPARGPRVNTYPTLIVDDELPARKRLAALLASHQDFPVVGNAANGDAAIRSIKSMRPAVVFLDIRMPGLDGMSVAKSVSALQQAPWVVFVTAFDQHAVSAFELPAIDYLLKPVAEDRLVQTLERIRCKNAQPVVVAENQEVEAQPDYERRMIVRNGQESLAFVKVDAIDWIQAAGKRVVLHCGDSQHSFPESISKIETRLDPAVFVRVHRSTIVRLDAVKSLEPLFHGDYRVMLESGTELNMSRSYSSKLRTRFGKLL